MQGTFLKHIFPAVDVARAGLGLDSVNQQIREAQVPLTLML